MARGKESDKINKLIWKLELPPLQVRNTVVDR